MDPNTTDPKQLFDVRGMVVVITGGASGIGLMMTKAFAQNGAAKVYIVGRRQDVLEEAARTASPHGNVIPVVGDVTSKESLAQVAEQVQRETGYVNLLCCNSGNMSPPVKAPANASIEELQKACLEQDMEKWHWYDSHLTKIHPIEKDRGLFSLTNMGMGFATNTTGVAFTVFSFLTLLDAGNRQNNCPGRHSQVLITSSIAGYLRVPTSLGNYPLTKAAATHLVKCMSGFLAPYAIRVNGIAPGLYPSDLADGLITSLGQPKGGDPSVQGAYERKVIPQERCGAQADMAGFVLFLASQAGAYVNGNIMVMDGGRVGVLPGTY